MVGGEFRFRLSRTRECAQDAQDRDVGGEDAETDGSNHGEAEDERHQERNHGCRSFRHENLSQLMASVSVVSWKPRWSFSLAQV